MDQHHLYLFTVKTSVVPFQMFFSHPQFQREFLVSCCWLSGLKSDWTFRSLLKYWSDCVCIQNPSLFSPVLSIKRPIGRQVTLGKEKGVLENRLCHRLSYSALMAIIALPIGFLLSDRLLIISSRQISDAAIDVIDLRLGHSQSNASPIRKCVWRVFEKHAHRSRLHW